jgi:hypothetical protein
MPGVPGIRWNFLLVEALNITFWASGLTKYVLRGRRQMPC